MINFNTAKKANMSQSLLPSFTEPTDITGESFKSVFHSIKNNSTNYLSNSHYRNEHVDNKEKNSSFVKIIKNNKSTENNKLNNEDKENYEAVERKVYRDDVETVTKKLNSNDNNQNVFEKKIINTASNEISENIKAGNNATREISAGGNEISMKDIILLLQTISKKSSVSNDEFANDDINQELSFSEDIVTDIVMFNLNISDELKEKLQNIISNLQDIPQPDLEKLLEDITLLSKNMDMHDINAENISLQTISEQIIGNEINTKSLESAYQALEEKVLGLQGKKSKDEMVNNLKTDNFTPNIMENANNNQDNQVYQSGIDGASDIINNITLLIDEAVSQAEISDNADKIDIAKNIFQNVKTAVENIIIQNSKDTVKQEITTLNQQEIVLEQITEENISDESVFLPEKTSDKVNAETVKEAVKDTVKVAKQADIPFVKDIQKEYKNINLEVSESVRAKSSSEAEAKATTVNLTETGKNLQNNTNQKEIIMAGNNSEENFSTSQSDKGNNFNYFLKSSAEAQTKYDAMQNKETQIPYNMKERGDIERLVRTMQSSVNKGMSKLTVVLTPENLGRLQIHLSEHAGKVTAKFLADNENSHKIIMAQSDLLKNQLSEKGIVVDNMEFAYNDAMSKQQNNDEQGRKASKNANKNMKNKEDDVETGTQVANKNTTGVYA